MISVIVPVYEEPLLLNLLLNSLSSQDYRGTWELLVSDDGSHSDILSIVRQLSTQHRTDVRYIWQPDLAFRAARARNNAIRCSQGDLLVFVDGDMQVRPDFLSSHASMHEKGSTIVCGTRKWENADGTPTTVGQTEAELQEQWYQSPSRWMAPLSCNFSVPKRPEVCFDERFIGWGCEDRELFIRLTQCYGYSVTLVRSIEATHLVHDGKLPSLNPLLSKDHTGLAQLIRNRLLLKHLHPDVDMTPLLARLRNCFLDPETDNWCAGKASDDRPLSDLVGSAERWMDRHGFSFRPDSAES
jgi:glycosyltransferase involved in cell wall biosynthesis